MELAAEIGAPMVICRTSTRSASTRSTSTRLLFVEINLAGVDHAEVDLVGADPQRTPLRAAVLANCVRVVFLTLGVLGDERAAGATTARPYIPGTGPKRGDGQPAW